MTEDGMSSSFHYEIGLITADCTVVSLELNGWEDENDDGLYVNASHRTNDL